MDTESPPGGGPSAHLPRAAQPEPATTTQPERPDGSPQTSTNDEVLASDAPEPLPGPDEMAEALIYDETAEPRRRLTDAEIDALCVDVQKRSEDLQRRIRAGEFDRPTCDCWEARSWRKYWAPEWIEFRQWLEDYNHALRIRQASHDVSDAMFPRRCRSSPTEAERVAAVLNEVTERYGEFEPARDVA